MSEFLKDDVLVLLGAGASIHADMPSVDGITERLQTCSARIPPWVRDVVKDFNIAPQYLSCYLEQMSDYANSKPNCKYEELLGDLEKKASKPSNSQDRERAIQLHTVAINTIIDAFRDEPHISQCGEENYRALFDQHRALLFTLNHDSVVEGYARKCGIPIADGFSFDHRGGYAVFDEENLRKSINAKKTILAHLHGSIFYSMPNRTTILKHPTVDSATAARLGGSKLVGEGDKDFFAMPIIAGINKDNSVDNTPVLKAYMSAFKCLCQNAKRMLIIGYGGNDLHINDQLSFAYKIPEVKIAYITKANSDDPLRAVRVAFPCVQSWTDQGGGDWKSSDTKVLVKTCGFPVLDKCSWGDVLSHLESSE